MRKCMHMAYAMHVVAQSTEFLIESPQKPTQLFNENGDQQSSGTESSCLMGPSVKIGIGTAKPSGTAFSHCIGFSYNLDLIFFFKSSWEILHLRGLIYELSPLVPGQAECTGDTSDVRLISGTWNLGDFIIVPAFAFRDCPFSFLFFLLFLIHASCFIQLALRFSLWSQLIEKWVQSSSGASIERLRLFSGVTHRLGLQIYGHFQSLSGLCNPICLTFTNNRTTNSDGMTFNGKH